MVNESIFWKLLSTLSVPLYILYLIIGIPPSLFDGLKLILIFEELNDFKNIFIGDEGEPKIVYENESLESLSPISLVEVILNENDEPVDKSSNKYLLIYVYNIVPSNKNIL